MATRGMVPKLTGLILLTATLVAGAGIGVAGISGVEVTKVVTGTAEEGTTFTVVLDCPEPTGPASAGVALAGGGDIHHEFVFGEEGGTSDLVPVPPNRECTITEDPPQGCTLTSIEPPSPFTVSDVRPTDVTVTNDCKVRAAAAEAEDVAPRLTG